MSKKSSTLDIAQMDREFSGRIKLLSARYGGVSRIARLCGFSEGVVRSWRDGRSDPSRARCLALAKGLGISLMWLVAGEGVMQCSSDLQTTETAAFNDTTNNHSKDSMGGMDPQRLAAAIEVLESTLRLAGADPSIAQNSDLLADYYELLGHTDPVERAHIAAALNKRLLSRLHRDEGIVQQA